MAAVPPWLEAQFGCILRDSAAIQSLLRTQLSATLPSPLISRKADTSAAVQINFELDMDNVQITAWQQWTTYDLFDASLPFVIPIPWGTVIVGAHARLLEAWQATRVDSLRWSVTGVMEIERASLPPFSGGLSA